MSIGLLLGGQHSVFDDVSQHTKCHDLLFVERPLQLQSLFFVLYLSMFTFDKRLPNCFPNPPPPLRHRWPEAFLDWMAPDQKLMNLGSSVRCHLLPLLSYKISAMRRGPGFVNSSSSGSADWIVWGSPSTSQTPEIALSRHVRDTILEPQRLLRLIQGYEQHVEKLDSPVSVRRITCKH